MSKERIVMMIAAACMSFIANTGVTAGTLARVDLAGRDKAKSVEFKVQTEGIGLDKDQAEAARACPLIDAAAGPFAMVTFTVDGKPVADEPVALADKASVLIPYGNIGAVRPSDLDAFMWDGAAKQWRLASGKFSGTPDGSFLVASDTEIYPALNALLTRPTRLGTIAVFVRRPSAGPVADWMTGMEDAAFNERIRGIKVEQNGRFYRIVTPSLEVVLGKADGAVYRYRVLSPSVFDFSPEGLGGLKLYLVDKSRNTGGFFDVAGAFDFSVQEFQDEPYLVIDIPMLAGGDAVAPLAKAKLQYRIGLGMTFVRGDFEFLKDDPDSSYEVGLWQRYNATDWQRQMFPTIAETLERPAMAKCFARFSDLEEDETQPTTDKDYFADNSAGGNLRSAEKAATFDPNKTEFLRSVAMPWSVVEGANSFLMYGFLNIQSVMIASPNRFKGLPSFTLQPKGIKKGRVYTFDYFLRFFPKPENTITDVCRWYAVNRYSTDPLSKDYVKFPAEGFAKRRTTPGLLTGDRAIYTAPGWNSYDEQYLIKGTWYRDVDSSNPIQFTPEKLAASYDGLRAQGKEIYPYTRQIRAWCAYHEDRPPYKRWCLKGKHGYPFSYMLGSMPVEKQLREQGPTNPLTCKLLGIEPEDAWKLEVHDDFCDPDLVDWYIRTHNEYQDFYKLNGFYFDMGWDTHVSPCSRHPQSGVFHGELKAVAEITNHGRAVDPKRRFLMNQNIHSPCLTYLDGTYINEGGVGANKLAMDSVKFNPISFYNLIYTGQWEEFYGKETYQDQMVLKTLRNMSYGILVTIDRGLFKTDLTSFDKADAQGKPAFAQFLAFNRDAFTMELAPQADAIVFIGEDPLVTGSVWAAPEAALAAFFNDSDQPRRFEAMINPKRLEQYGWKGAFAPGFQLVGLQGDKAEEAGCKVTEAPGGWTRIEGVLAPQTLLLARQDIQGR